MLAECGVEAQAVKWSQELDGLDGLIVPGGESTTIGKLMVRYGFHEAIPAAHAGGMAIYGTCAGLIILAKKITEGAQPLLGLLDVEARRNAFGRQVASFEADLALPILGDIPFKGVFIRAPWVERALAEDVEVLATHNGHIVAVRQGRLLASAFHPELTDDGRMHEYFLEKVVASARRTG
ncbi:MAG: pyridoxal 5'-phosphate synthase glutaminase subunit PdxT [Chloroflexi bacterium]|nr:pyridoxal 5'-phosphate synthase glutaminase subunit PdxT [Chloroflexota bacterium]